MDSSRVCVQNCVYPTDLQDAKRLFEKNFIQEILIQNHGNVSKTARMINTVRRNLQAKIIKYEIDLDAIRDGLVKPARPSKEALKNAVTIINDFIQA